MILYDGLLTRLKERGMTRTDLASTLGISSRTIAKIAKGEKLSRATLQRIASYLDCDPDSLCKEVSDNPILKRLGKWCVVCVTTLFTNIFKLTILLFGRL